jgi:hypothetical protein
MPQACACCLARQDVASRARAASSRGTTPIHHSYWNASSLGILAARLLFNKMQLYFVVPQVQVSGIVMLNLCEYYDNTTPKTLAAF